MKIRLVQKEITDLDLKKHLDNAGHAAIDLVCFGELGGTGCLYGPRDVQPAEYWQSVSHEYPFKIMIGTWVKSPQGLHNSYLYLANGGCQAYHKIHLFPGMKEDQVYVAGTEPFIADTAFGRTGVTICYDIRFGDLYSGLAKAGATTVLVPAAFPRVRISDWRELLVQRAKENRVRIVGINSVGNDGTNEFGGCTTVVEPDGSIRFQADETSAVAIDFEI